jgi:DNA-directed RNA polymerase subunit RPC12/RpoP
MCKQSPRHFESLENELRSARQTDLKEDTEMKGIVRCPYCILGLEFRPMVAHVDGRYICNKCGHTTHPRDAKYECHCTKCTNLRSRAFLAS